ncbi:hypothetical protein CDL12_13454 [Handroanthus impetiginosus]|uniref:Uncharacterized protein n=1 Tax=Handroanthus impetiginosus TaxID=429701 RepID=A0A2G9H8T8_9LAMI|nr:hypothetical protein CDL12_13454 [Handroanthus impetiginosus]
MILSFSVRSHTSSPGGGCRFSLNTINLFNFLMASYFRVWVWYLLVDVEQILSASGGCNDCNISVYVDM